MTDKVAISPGHDNLPPATANAFMYGGGAHIADGTTLIADEYSGLAAGPYNGFNHIGTSGFDVTIDTGEGVVGGAPLARDTQTTVTLASNTTNQTVYVGWATNATDSITIGVDADFSTGEFRTALWEFDTDGSTIIRTEDVRPLGRSSADSDLYYSRDEANAAFVEADGDDIPLAVGAALTATTNDANQVYDLRMYDSDVSNLTNSGMLGSAQGTLFLSDSRIIFAESDNDEIKAWLNVNNGNFDVIGNIDIHGNEMEGMRLENRSTRPSSPSPGRLIYRSDRD